MGKERGKKALLVLLKFIILPILLDLLFSWKLSLIFLFLVIIQAIFKIRKRKYLMKDKEGNKVKTKEFFKRWKKGIEGITPLQQAKTNVMGIWITMTGIIAGLVINALVRMQNQWVWIEIILIGSFTITLMSLVSGMQKYWRLKELNKAMKELEE